MPVETCAGARRFDRRNRGRGACRIAAQAFRSRACHSAMRFSHWDSERGGPIRTEQSSNWFPEVDYSSQAIALLPPGIRSIHLRPSTAKRLQPVGNDCSDVLWLFLCREASGVSKQIGNASAERMAKRLHL